MSEEKVMTMELRRFDRRTSDEGSALLMAVAVSIIGLALSIIVVGQSIIVTQDSARDRVRTLEVHAAEAMLDATMLQLESGSPCGGSDVVGSGNTAVKVEAVVTYYTDANVAHSCSNGTVSGTAGRAEVEVTATSDYGFVGIAPERTFAASVKLEPLVTAEPGTAIFSAGGIQGTGGGFTLLPLDPSAATAVWIDGNLSDGAGGNNYSCSINVTIQGDVYVTDGYIDMRSASCYITGNAWARTGFSNSNAPAFAHTVGGNLTVYNGNFTVNNTTKIGGNLAVNGYAATTNGKKSQYWWGFTQVGGSSCSVDTTPCGTLDLYEPRGLPEIDYKPGDWSGFTVKSKTDYDNQFITQWNLTETWQKDAVKNANCEALTWLSTKAISFPSSPTIYDLRTCAFGTTGGGVYTMKLYSDVAIFSKAFNNNNELHVESGDGNPHKLWFIVPEGGTADNGIAETTARGSYTPGNISIGGAGIHIDPDISIFLYTPGNISYNSRSDIYGEMYGKSVTVGAAGQKYYYKGNGVPGVNLTTGSSESGDGFEVGIENKHETRN